MSKIIVSTFAIQKSYFYLLKRLSFIKDAFLLKILFLLKMLLFIFPIMFMYHKSIMSADDQAYRYYSDLFYINIGQQGRDYY